MQKIWICPRFLEFDCYRQCGDYTAEEEVNRALKIWKHAESCLNRDKPTEFDLSDSIGWLKGALNQRLKLIEATYYLKGFALENSPKGYLEYLETLNIVRPYMLKKLMTIRNDIEHNDATPPELERCSELLDLVWYFIRSTDELVKIKKNSMIFEESNYWLNIDFKFEPPYILKVHGWIEPNMISDTYVEDWVEINAEKYGTKLECWPDSEDHDDQEDGDYCFNGIMNPMPVIANKLIMKTIHIN